MNTRLSAAMLAMAVTPGMGHRLDEYLQGSIVSVEKNRVQVEMILTPGVSVFPQLIAKIDTNADGTISAAEQQAYAARVLADLRLAIDGRSLQPRLASIQFPSMDDMKEGRGEIQLDFHAALPAGGRNRKLTIENHHQSSISAYQVNCLVPGDPAIRIETQKRNYTQSQYELDYVQTDVAAEPWLAAWRPRGLWLGPIALLLFSGEIFWRRQRYRVAGPARTDSSIGPDQHSPN